MYNSSYYITQSNELRRYFPDVAETTLGKLDIVRAVNLHAGTSDLISFESPNKYNTRYCIVKGLKPTPSVQCVRNKLIQDIKAHYPDKALLNNLKTPAAKDKIHVSLDFLIYNFAEAYRHGSTFRGNPIQPTCYIGLTWGNNSAFFTTKPDHYRQKLSATALHRVLSCLCNMGYISIYPSNKEGVSSKLRATPRLKDLLWEAGHYVPVKAKAKSRPLVATKLDDNVYETVSNDPAIPVLTKMNSLLEKTNVSLTPTSWQDYEKCFGYRREGTSQIYRVYSKEEGKHGRFYTGYINCPPDIRQEITFNGKPTVELDYQASQLHVVYSLAGVNYWDCHTGDPYRINGCSDKDRAIYKDLFTIMLNTSGAAKVVADKKIAGYDLTTCHKMVKVFKEYHKPIAHLLKGQHGMDVAKAETCVTLDVLRKLGDSGIPTMPVHDSFIVSQEDSRALREAMIEAYNSLDYPSVPAIH